MVILDHFYEGDERFRCTLHKDCGYLIYDNERDVIGMILYVFHRDIPEERLV